MDAGLVLNDLATNFERVADHCSNIGVCVIQSEEEAFDTHEYLDTLDKGKDSWFNARYEVYKQNICCRNWQKKKQEMQAVMLNKRIRKRRY